MEPENVQKPYSVTDLARTALGFLDRLDPMAIQAEELDMPHRARDDRLVERDAVHSGALGRPTPIDVVYLQHSFVADATAHADTAEFGYGSVTRRSITPVPAVSRKFAYPASVSRFPLIHLGLPAEVDAVLASAALPFGVRSVAVNARSQFGHVENTTGQRNEVLLDD